MGEAFVSDLKRARGLGVVLVWTHAMIDFFVTLGQEWFVSFREWWSLRKQKGYDTVERNGMMRGVFQDVRLGVRVLARSP